VAVLQGERIGELFIRRGLLTREQLQSALEKQRQLGGGKPLGELLVSLGFVTERDRVRIVGEHWGIEYVDLPETALDPDAVHAFSQDLARRYMMVGVEIVGNKLRVAMKNPLDVFATDEIRLVTGKEVVPLIAPEEDILAAINDAYRSTSDTLDNVLKNFHLEDIDLETGTLANADGVSSDELEEAAAAPIVQLANAVIQRAIEEKASDIHLEPSREGVRVRYRIDGILVDGLDVPKSAQLALASRIKIMADLDIAEKRAPQDGRISLRVNGRQFDFRVSTLPAVFGEKIVMRVLDKSSINVGLHKLGLLPHTFEMYESMLMRSYGILLVTGPTGSGKSSRIRSNTNWRE